MAAVVETKSVSEVTVLQKVEEPQRVLDLATVTRVARKTTATLLPLSAAHGGRPDNAFEVVAPGRVFGFAPDPEEVEEGSGPGVEPLEGGAREGRRHFHHLRQPEHRRGRRAHRCSKAQPPRDYEKNCCRR